MTAGETWIMMVIARTKSGPAVASRGTVDKALFRCACVLTLPQWGIAAGTDVPERRFSFVTFPTVHRVSTLRRVAREAHRQARTCATQVPGVRRTRWIGSPSPYLRTTRPRKVQRPSRFVFSVSLGGRPNTKEVRRLSNFPKSLFSALTPEKNPLEYRPGIWQKNCLR